MTTLQMSQDVQARLKKHMTNDNEQLILDFDDGVGAYSKVGVCSLDVSFRFLIVNKSDVDPIYDEALASPLGPVLIKGYADNFLNEAPELNMNKFGLISLKTAAGIIDTNVEILDHPEMVATAK
ncbi:iron-sulfur cluster biosynthesis family protein [Secundilactobacillus yichangensis]|uniref:iron-sulfur cluster biosynthesis family protein n=1 Tax=Secundilactobacillus yichangensis TaxID=2799580 RepID=UPI001945480F|nr:iron-sulfur cluster biosynthesis family protein [Secundilactobacillus yichangensis]